MQLIKHTLYCIYQLRLFQYILNYSKENLKKKPTATVTVTLTVTEIKTNLITI